MRKYKNGYAEKILYWTEQLEIATVEGKWFQMERAMAKLQWFVEKQSDLLYSKREMATKDC